MSFLSSFYPQPVVPNAIEVTASGSNTARTLSDRFGERVNVLDFGADPTGASDSTAAIALAAAALPNGGVIYFPAGTYLKDANQTGFTNISFEGEHRTRTTIKARVQGTVTSSIFRTTGNNLSCRNLTLDCNWQNLRIYNGKINAIEIYGDNCFVDSCRIINFGGCYQAAQESFPIIVQGINCAILHNVVEQPVVGLNSSNNPENNPYCTHVSLFSTELAQAVAAISSSNASENTITVSGNLNTLVNGDRVMFTALVGGSPLQINTVYYVIEKSNATTFKLATTPTGSAIDFEAITSASMGSVTVGGTGFIIGNYLKGTFEEGDQTNFGQQNEYLDSSFGAIGGSGYDALVVRDNTFLNLGAGFNGDSWHNGTLIIENNYFKNCQRGINLTYYGNSPDPKLRIGYIRNNVVRTTANALIGGAAGRFENIDNIFVENNYVDTWDDTVAVEGCFYFKGIKQAAIKNNVFHTNVGTGNCIDTGVASWVVSGNTDQNGIQRYEYNVRTNNAVVSGNKNALSNGLELGRAIAAAAASQPAYSSRSSTNRFVVYINNGNYDLNGYSSSPIGDFNNNIGHIGLIGIGEKLATRITHGASYVLNITPNSPNITVANLTLVAANSQIALYQSSISSALFTDVVFDKDGTGTIVPEGQFQHLGKFVRCSSIYPFHAVGNLQGNFGGECYDCQWLGGFSTVYVAGTNPILRNTIIVGRLFTANAASAATAASNLKLENCRIFAATGTSNQNILIGSNCLITNCTFKNSRLVVLGSDNEIYNSTFDMDAGQANCIAEASGQTGAVKLFNIGSNKPIDSNLTITSIDLLNTTLRSPDGSSWRLGITNDGELEVIK